MKTKSSRWGCLAIGFIIFLMLMAGGGWWWFQSQYGIAEGSPPSPVQVFLVAPTDGSEFRAGDVIPVEAQAIAPQAIQSLELFVDGVAYGGPVPPQEASWAWPAFPAGIHTLSARATAADGQMGYSQTVIVNVLTGDGTMQVSSNEGQTLGDVGSGFGVPPDQMAAANPNLDPGLPLADGQPVNVPVGNPKPGGGPGGSAGGGPLPYPVQIISIAWKFTPTSPVDKSYCYTSTGNGIWEKMPKQPFEFFGGGQLEYLQKSPPFNGGQMVIQMQCWGWLAGALKFLGQGEAKFDSQSPPGELKVSGQGFVLVGLPEIPLETGGAGVIPPPFAVREPANTAECLSHNHPILGGLVCDTLLNAAVKEYTILVWEWEPKLCLPTDCTWVNKIDGYRVYEIDAFTNQVKYLKDVNNPSQKSSAVPLPWGAKCYGVSAYVNNPAIETSDMAVYCNDKLPAVQKITLTPTDWLTTGGEWIQDGDCDSYGGADYYLLSNKDSGFGNNVGEVFVGSYIVDDDDADCFRQGDYSGAVKFPHPVLPPGAVVQKSILKFAEYFTDYHATGIATNYSLFCVGGVGKAKQSWTGLITGNHFVGKNVLSGAAYYSSLTSLTGWDATPEVDVTSTVKSWISNPQADHGFILRALPAPNPASDGSGSCLSGAGDFKLEIFYFAPP